MREVLYKHRNRIIPAVLLVVALLVYGIGYGWPKSMFWDENYHIASAQKHIDGVMYMEPHPPLGKMLMGLSEAVVGANSERDMSRLNSTDYLNGNAAPAGMEYWGFRLPSTFLMAFSVLFFFGILHRITRRAWLAAGFSTLIIFDNALVVHSRSAMLEGIQLFFMLAAIYYMVRVITNRVYHGRDIRLGHYAILGVLIGLGVAVKLNGAVLLLLFVMLYGADQWENIRSWRWPNLFKRLGTTVPAGVLPLLATFFAVFYVHIGMGDEIVKNRTYKASPEYLEYIREGETWTPSVFVTGMKDHWRYMAEYADGVPRLDVCKPGENGSHAMGWPIGKKSINYRWDKNTVDGEVQVRYIQLIGNPIVWLSVLAGVVLSVGLVISRFVYGNPEKDRPLFMWICAFTGLYVSYMIAILQIERVMYLYHYLVPLVFGMINVALVFTYIFRDEVLANNRHTMINLAGFALLVIGVFAFFAPFSYGLPITANEFALRDWFGFWKMDVVR